MKGYEELLELKVFNMQDTYKKIGNINTAKKTINRLLKEKLIKKVKYNLYTICDMGNKMSISNKHMIASKIKEDSFICYHSALDYYGLRNQVFYVEYIATSKKFEDFEFENFTYTWVNNKLKFGIVEENKIRVTDKERTVLDCINKSELAGGEEELYLSLELIQKLDNYKILEYLKKYNSKSLYVKTGFILELLKNRLGTTEELIKECKKHVKNSKIYFSEKTKTSDSKFIKEWNLVVPEMFIKRGGTLYW